MGGWKFDCRGRAGDHVLEGLRSHAAPRTGDGIDLGHMELYVARLLFNLMGLVAG
jgi:hypothetical protein